MNIRQLNEIIGSALKEDDFIQNLKQNFESVGHSSFPPNGLEVNVYTGITHYYFEIDYHRNSTIMNIDVECHSPREWEEFSQELNKMLNIVKQNKVPLEYN